MRIAIHQPQFLPWLGYLDKIDRVDLFVLLDSVQFKKNEWQNRNRIRTAQGWQWVTVPVLHDFGQRIKDVRINDKVDWRAKHLRAMELHYAHAAHREHVLGGLRALYQQSWDRLADLNIAVLRWLLGEFGITTPLRLSSDMQLPEEPTERLIEICRVVGAASYLAGAGARDYMDFQTFEAAGIPVDVQEFQHPVYRQCYEPFAPGLSAIDLLLTCGGQSIQSLRSMRAEGRRRD
ncbi:MAG TPA: WbqC family protein [Nitrospiraceae bacterium]